jgi:peptide/nickel transport system permease protein
VRVLRSPVVLLGGAIVTSVVVVGVLAPLIAPHDPRALTGTSLEPPSSRHLLGTNDIGQDLLSQLVWGARWALVVALAGATVATVVGGLVGAAAGLLGGAADAVAMRAVDTFVAMPAQPLLVLIAALAGPNPVLVVVIVGLAGWPLVARPVRAQARSLRQRGFVSVARGFGAGPFYVLRRHLVPGLGPVLVSRFLLWAPIAVLIEAGLAFLGLSDPLTPSWGRMLNQALNYQGLYFNPLWPWWVLPAGFAVAVTMLGFALVGVGLEPWFNPRARRAS